MKISQERMLWTFDSLQRQYEFNKVYLRADKSLTNFEVWEALNIWSLHHLMLEFLMME